MQKRRDKIKIIKGIHHLLHKNLNSCSLCPRRCQVNRFNNKKGICDVKDKLVVYAAFLHKGEEPPISGKKGSGTIFFSGCNLRCVYCQNYKFSHKINGKIVTPYELSKIMLTLQYKGAHNINLVTATPMLPFILESLLIALENGLNLPIVYNSSGYESVDILRMLKGIIDIYLVDFKYITPRTSKELSKAIDYPHIAKEAIKEMYRQRKIARFEENIMQEGIIIRHLIIPNHIEESKRILLWLKDNTPLGYISIMSQYQPYHKAYLYPSINRPINKEEYTAISNFIEEIGIEKGWQQDFTPLEALAGVHFAPEFPL